MKSIKSKWNNISIANKLYFIVGCMATLIIGELLVVLLAMNTLTAARAFVAGEGLWSKAQKNAVISLQHYGSTHDPKYFIAAENYLKIPEGDHIARIELTNPNPDLELAKEGFRQGQIPERDIEPMFALIRRFHRSHFVKDALAIWAQGDSYLLILQTVAKELHQSINTSDKVRERFALNEIQKINVELTRIESEFSTQLGGISHWLEDTLLVLLTIAVLAVEAFGLTLTMFTIKSISRRLKDVNQSTERIGNGDFAISLNMTESKDEIGRLANSIALMGKMLKLSYADLEERVRARTNELSQSRDQLDIILRGISDGITVLDTNGNFVFANQAAASMCGYDSVEEFVKTPHGEVLKQVEISSEADQPYPLDELPSKMALAGRTDAPEVVLQVKVKRTGQKKWFIVTATPIFNDARKTNLVVTIFKDFTEYKRGEEAVKFLDLANKTLSSSLDYEVTLQNLSNLIVPHLADWCFINIVEDKNRPPRSLAIAHKDREKINRAKEISEKYPPIWNANFGSASVLRNGKSELYTQVSDDFLEHVAQSPDHLNLLRQVGIRSIMIVPLISRGKAFATMSLISAESNRIYLRQDLHFVEDLALRASVAIDNALLYKNVQTAVKARDEFLSIASHELKTPLTSLSLQMQMTRQSIVPRENRMPTCEKLASVFDIMDKQMTRLTRLVEDLLDVARIRSGNLSFEFETINLTELVNEMMSRFSSQLIKVNCSLKLDLQKDVIGVFDRGRIEQIVENLMGNAIKYAPGSEITVTVQSSNESIILAIQDSGPGIPLDRQKKIFDRFERANSSKAVNGLGLGLFIVKEVVKAHHGEVYLESEPGKGSKFIVELPAYASNFKKERPLDANA